MSYVGVPPFGQTVRTVTERIAQQDQTIFYPDGGYLPGYIDVELDGSDLGSQDFTATDGLSVVLAQKAGAGSLFRTKAYWPVSLIDTMRRGEINSIVGAGGWAMRNRVINGAMSVAQYGASTTVNGGGTRGFSVDRFAAYSATNACTVSQSSVAPSGFSKSLQYTQTGTGAVGAGDIGLVIHRVEGLNTSDLNWGTSAAAPVTISFWARSSLTGTFGLTVLNDGQDRRYTTSYTITQANTWEQKTIVIPGCTDGTWRVDNGIGLGVCWDMGCGTSYSAAADTVWGTSTRYGLTGGTKVCATTGATFNITGVQLEKGSYATPFDFRPYGAELALCQRYFERGNPKVFVNGTYALGAYTNTGTGSYSFKQVKRASPTMTMNGFNNIDNASNAGIYATGGQDSGDSFCFTLTINSYTNYPYALAYINFSASSEL